MDEHHCLGELCSCPAGRPFHSGSAPLVYRWAWGGDTEQQSRWQEETQLAGGNPAGRQGGFSWELGLEARQDTGNATCGWGGSTGYPQTHSSRMPGVQQVLAYTPHPGPVVEQGLTGPPGPSHPTWCLLCSSRCLSIPKACVRRYRWHPHPPGTCWEMGEAGEGKSLGHPGIGGGQCFLDLSAGLGMFWKLIYSHPGCEPPLTPGPCSRRPGYH